MFIYVFVVLCLLLGIDITIILLDFSYYKAKKKYLQKHFFCIFYFFDFYAVPYFSVRSQPGLSVSFLCR